MRKKLYALVFSLCSVAVSMAQSIKGTVVDETNNPLPFANVLLQDREESFISGTTTDNEGNFTLKTTPDATTIEISYIGYSKVQINTAQYNSDTIKMTPDRNLLGEVVIRDYIPKTKIQGGALVTKVENSILAESGSANDVLKKLPGVSYMIVNEAGASVYSASPLAAEEFPDYDVNLRSAVSIARRLQDPLAELVKIDPKSLGVGQYQHDVDQTLLRETLDNTVVSCVNNVGVNLNTASSYLLSYVSGIGPALADNIVEYRSENGPYASRKDLLKVKRLGAKAFEQCAGFLRIHGAKNPLDNSAVHPEAYHIVDKMASDLGVTAKELVGNADLCSRIDPAKYVDGDFGLPTVTDIIQELRKPGRDPRESAQEFEFAHDIRTIEDVKTGMELPGIVTNITAFGAFVDIGIKQNGLIHASQMGVKGMADPSKILKLRQQIKVQVTSVDLDRLRIGLRLVK